MAESSRRKRRRQKVVQNPYQKESFPNIPRLLLISVLLAIPIALFFLTKNDSTSKLENDETLSQPRGLDERLFSSFNNDVDPHMKTMSFLLPGESEERTHPVYVQPDVSTFYNEPPGTRQKKAMRFHGMAGKFINISPTYLSLYWDDGRDGVLIADMPPFQAVGTATFPSHRFFLALKNDPGKVIFRMHMNSDTNLYVYDAFELGHDKLDELNSAQMNMYQLQKNNVAFAEAYKKFTGRDWLSLYPSRQKAMYKMWNADYFGQQHWVTTRENHYIIEPPEDVLGPLSEDEMHRDRNLIPDPRKMDKYRAEDEVLNMTMTVLSCAPRVFEIKNFLSHAEVDHIGTCYLSIDVLIKTCFLSDNTLNLFFVVHMATGMKLSLSTTSGSDGGDRRSDTKTRTSKNSWVKRKRSPIMDSIYGRAADLMQIDEALLRSRHEDEFREMNHKGSNAEDLQLVHYAESEQYTPHHDFSYPNSNKGGQPARFATLLLYLNEGMVGGETTFPRWLNSEKSEKLRVIPEVGKAILFYDQLPDGNMDDLSQHAAESVRKGEKWLINLWTWDPSFR
jgi:prolyl 4-hydroxylase